MIISIFLWSNNIPKLIYQKLKYFHFLDLQTSTMLTTFKPTATLELGHRRRHRGPIPIYKMVQPSSLLTLFILPPLVRIIRSKYLVPTWICTFINTFNMPVVPDPADFPSVTKKGDNENKLEGERPKAAASDFISKGPQIPKGKFTNCATIWCREINILIRHATCCFPRGAWSTHEGAEQVEKGLSALAP